MRFALLPVLAALACAPAPRALAHPLLDVRIAAASERIAADPDDAGRRLERAALHRDHADWTAARADLDAARGLARDDDRDAQVAVDHAEALLALAMGHPGDALLFLDVAVTARPADPDLLVTRARCLEALGGFERAADDLARAAVLVPRGARPKPDLYVRRARLLLSSGSDRAMEAVFAIEEGRSRLGASAAFDAVEREAALCAREAAR